MNSWKNYNGFISCFETLSPEGRPKSVFYKIAKLVGNPQPWCLEESENVDEHSSWKVVAEFPEKKESQRLSPNVYVLTLPKSLADPLTNVHKEDSKKPS